MPRANLAGAAAAKPAAPRGGPRGRGAPRGRCRCHPRRVSSLPAGPRRLRCPAPAAPSPWPRRPWGRVPARGSPPSAAAATASPRACRAGDGATCAGRRCGSAPCAATNATQTVEEEKPEPPTIQEIKQKIEKYNAKVTNCLVMKLNDDGTYTGFIKVHLKLRRPVTVPAGIRPQSIYDALHEVNLAEMTHRRTSFYLPLDAVKQLHISSTTTVGQVIQALLKKFMVVDNPQKFALFKEMRKDGQVLFQKLPLTEYPLYLRLLAGPDTDVLSFVLKENETGEVEWEAFSIPELQNFLMILEKEEKDKIQQVHKKYERFKQRLQQTLKEARGKPG
ncbi:ras association domain-containing protein 5 isoform X1 [Passer montanus]|uniref:ras association domain-containing protein 5 isoform X1 n=1 Tax=Passer montanus TaxID=9160 RepID=UPI00196070C9|nr:ras association domain-containing protein 5 isoform X1 [Passer montanus]